MGQVSGRAPVPEPRGSQEDPTAEHGPGVVGLPAGPLTTACTQRAWARSGVSINQEGPRPSLIFCARV